MLLASRNLAVVCCFGLYSGGGTKLSFSQRQTVMYKMYMRQFTFQQEFEMDDLHINYNGQICTNSAKKLARRTVLKILI